MKYVSTRDMNCKVSAAQAIVNGLSQDGGLFVPEEIPQVDFKFIESLSKMDYPQRAKALLGLYLTDFTAEEIAYCVGNAYTRQKFETEAIAPLYKLNGHTYFLELWHGPTCAFKDMALQILPYLLTTSIKKIGEEKTVVILVATSGDTGKAALEGFKDVNGTKIMVFYPKDGVSEIQRLQMATQEGQNVFVMAVNGNFDDAQNGVKAIFTDHAYEEELAKKGYMLSSANSINWGRLLPQIVYYFSAYAELLKSEEIALGDTINVVVPTGNFGNILAAYYAKEMGLPIRKLICASNENNVLTDFMHTGVYNKNRPFKLTCSPSMDILISSNLERLLFHLAGNDCAAVKQWMGALSSKGVYEIAAETLEKIQALFWAGCADDEMTKASIRKTQSEQDYLMDTHTAVAKNVYDQYVTATGDTTKTVIASTANPFKFNKSVAEAVLGRETAEAEGEFELLKTLSDKLGLRVPASLASLNEKPQRFQESIEKQSMKAAVSDFLK